MSESQGGGNLFLKAIEGAFNGTVPPEKLGQAIESARHSIQEHQEAFHVTLDALTPEVREACQPLIDSAEELIEAVYRSLELATEYLSTGDKQLLIDSGTLAGRATDQLNILFFELRNAALKAQGPTEIPNLNLILHAFELCQTDLSKGEHLRGLVEMERISSIGALRDLENAPAAPEVELLKQAFDRHLRCMNRLAIGFDAGKLEDVAKEVENAKTTFERIKEVMPSAQMAQRTTGPTKDPQTNLVISLAQDVESGAIHEAVLVEALQTLYDTLKETRDKFEEAAARPTDSVLVEEEIEKAREALELQDVALREFAEFLNNREVLVMRSAIAKLEESAHAIFECYETFQSISEREGKTLCIRCSHYNPAGRKNCEKCGAPLPVMASGQGVSTVETGEGGAVSAQPGGPVLTDNMVRIYNAVNHVHDGTITMDKFLEEVDWFEGILSKNSEWDQDEPDLESLPEDERPAAEAALKALEELEEIFRQGWQELQSAIEHFRNYAESEDRTLLEEGVRLCDSGARKLAAVRDNTRKAGDGTEAEAASSGAVG